MKRICIFKLLHVCHKKLAPRLIIVKECRIDDERDREGRGLKSTRVIPLQI